VAAAVSDVNLPDGFSGFGSAEAQALLSGTFEFMGPSPMTAVFTTSLIAVQGLFTTGTGVSATSEVIYTLVLPDIQAAPILSFDHLLTIGPNQSMTYVANPTVSASVLLRPDTLYSFVAALDAESSGVSTPEPASLGLLLTAAGCTILLLRRARQRGTQSGS
jgi:hypothetical protein